MSGPVSSGPIPVGKGEIPGLEVVEALCRLQLEARRLGCTMCICQASEELRTLIRLAGLDDVLICDPGPEPEARDPMS